MHVLSCLEPTIPLPMGASHPSISTSSPHRILAVYRQSSNFLAYDTVKHAHVHLECSTIVKELLERALSQQTLDLVKGASFYASVLPAMNS